MMRFPDPLSSWVWKLILTFTCICVALGSSPQPWQNDLATMEPTHKLFFLDRLAHVAIFKCTELGWKRWVHESSISQKVQRSGDHTLGHTNCAWSEWPEWDRLLPARSSFQSTAEEQCRILSESIAGTGSSQACHQSQRSAAIYVEEFRLRASLVEWPAASCTEAFLQGLADTIKDLMAAYGKPTSLDGAIKLALQLELQVQACGGSGHLSPLSRNVSDGDLAPLPLPSQAASSEPAPEPNLYQQQYLPQTTGPTTTLASAAALTTRPVLIVAMTKY